MRSASSGPRGSKQGDNKVAGDRGGLQVIRPAKLCLARCARSPVRGMMLKLRSSDRNETNHSNGFQGMNVPWPKLRVRKMKTK